MYFSGGAKTVKDITIEWTYPAYEFEIAVLNTNSVWQTIVYMNKNDKKKNEL